MCILLDNVVLYKLEKEKKRPRFINFMATFILNDIIQATVSTVCMRVSGILTHTLSLILLPHSKEVLGSNLLAN